MISKLFWLTATLEIALAIGFAVLVNKVPNVRLTPNHFNLAKSQKKDNWLACIVIWAVVFSEGLPVRTILWAAGTLVLGWLIHRALLRVHRIRSEV